MASLRALAAGIRRTCNLSPPPGGWHARSRVHRARCRAALARRSGRRARRLAALVLAPVMAVATSLVPVGAAVVAGAGLAAVSAVVSAPKAKAATTSVLVLLQNGETTAPEATVLQNAGYSVTQVTPSTWQGMSASAFQAYAALVIGDPSSGGTCSTLTPTTGTSGSDALGTNWQAAVTGNIAVLGTAPAAAGTSAANTLVSAAVGYAAAGYSSSNSTGTGLYVSLNCEYSTVSAGTSMPLLNGVEGIGTAGGLTVQGGLSCSDAGMVNTWEATASGTFNGFTSSQLSPGSWPSPGCPVQEAFNSWPSMFIPVGYDAASDVTANFTASDGVNGQGYLLLGAPVSAATAKLAPSAGGEVLAGTTAGGASNPAAPGLAQATAGDPVNTENGDFAQSNTDLSIPGFGPGLGFTRTYDALTAQQQTQAGAPGPMGYGWTDNWASSLATGRPVPGDIYTLDGLATNNGNGGPPTSAPLNGPAGVTRHNGDSYIADTQENRIQEIPGSSGTQWGIAMTAGDVYTIAGSPTGAVGDSPDGTPAASALLNEPWSVTFDAANNLYIADSGNNRVLEIPVASGGGKTADDIYTFAGNSGGAAGHSGDGGAATSALLSAPRGLATAPSTSDIYIADWGNNRVQEVPAVSGGQWGMASMTAGDIYTIAGSSTGAAGDSGNGVKGTSALLRNPEGISFRDGGKMFIADTGNNRIIEEPNVSGTWWNIPMTAFDIYTVAGSATGAAGSSGDGSPATAAKLNAPASLTVANNGQLYIADTGNNRIQEVALTGHTEWGVNMAANDIYTIAGSASAAAGSSGNGGAATAALLSGPAQVALDLSNNLYIADTGNAAASQLRPANSQVREVSASTYNISGYAGGVGTLLQDGNGGPATTAGLDQPYGLASDPAGNVYIADTSGNRIQEIVASNHTQWGQQMIAGDVYTVAGSAAGFAGNSGDGGPARSALLHLPSGVATDAAGDLYIADLGNSRVQEVSAATGNISTIAGSSSGAAGISGDGGPATSALLYNPAGLAVDPAGDVYIADTYNSRVQEVFASGGSQWGQHMIAGDIYTVAGSATGSFGSTGDGGPGSSALLSHPTGVAVDAAGNLYIADWFNNRVQELAAVTAAHWGQHLTVGDIYTVAGSATGTWGVTGDGGPATSALLNGLYGVAIDSSGNIYIADNGNNRVQEIAATNGTQWGTAMTAGNIYTVVGSAAGTGGQSGDGAPATSALLNGPVGIAVDPSGDLYFNDQTNNRIREVTATTTQAFPEYPAGGGVTITQADGAQITFNPQAGGACTAPYVKAGGYCALPQDINATLTFNSGNQTYTYSPAPGMTYTYGWNGALTAETDAAGDTLTLTYQTPAPGSGQCPSTATSCNTITSASGRALVVGLNASGQVISVTDPLGRTWTYGYTGSDLTSAADPMGNKTSYTYGAATTGNPALANDLLTITSPNAQPGGPDAGDSTLNVYNPAGQVTSQIDPMGFKTTFDYTGMNSATGTGVVRVADPDGNTTVYDYTQGALAAQSAWTGTTLTSEQDDTPNTTAGGTSGGTLLDTTSTDGDGNTTSYTYDTSGNTTTTTAPDGVGSQTGTTTAQYTALDTDSCDATAQAATPCSASQTGPTPVAPGGVITPPASAPPAGETWTLYDTDGNQLYTTTGVYEPGSNTAAYSRTTYQLFTGNSIALGGTNITCTSTPPSPSLPCATISANRVVTQLQYDSQGDLTSSSTPDGNGTQLATTTDGYNADGEQTFATAPDGNVTGANAGNYTTTIAWNADDQKTTVSQAGGTGATVTPRATSYGYDANGNQTTIQEARGFTTTTTYNADNKPTLVTNPDSNATLTCYDGAGNVTETVPPIGVAANSLTPSSCPSSYPAGYGVRLAGDVSTYSFDADGNQVATNTPAPAGQTGYETTSYVYDGNGNLTKTTAPPTANNGPNQVTVDTYTTTGKVASETSGYGTSAASTISYCYDPNGDKTSVVYADGNTGGPAACSSSSPWAMTASPQVNYQTSYAYDSIGELVSTTTPKTAAAMNGATTTSTYDVAGNMLTSTDPNGVTTTWTYTPLNLPATVSYSGNSAHSVTYAYDADGNKTGMTDATGTSSYIYDPFGEFTSAQNGAGQVTGYEYNADGQVTSITYPLSSNTWATSNTVSYGYDNADQLTSVTDFNGHQMAIGNSADGLPNSVTLGSSGDTVTTSYDNDAPSAITLKNATSTLQSFTYTDAPSANILNETDTPDSSQSPAVYTYDAQGRVTSDTPGSDSTNNYSFDASGNLTMLPTGGTGTYDNAGELTSQTQSGTTTNYTYNADGQQLTATQGSATVSQGSRNGAGQLTTYNDAVANMTTASYDGNGLRASTTITPAGGSAATQGYVWNTVPSVPELLMDGTSAYIYVGGLAPAEQVNLSSGTITYLITDRLSSVRGTVSTSGTLTGTCSYDAWGSPQTTGGLTARTPFGYAGGYTDPTGLIYLINRYYSPAAGQFISVDPDIAQTSQPYAYTDGNPVSNTDPLGLCGKYYCAWEEYRLVTKTFIGYRNGDWVRLFWVTASSEWQHVQFSITVSLSVTISGAISTEIPHSVISADVGFNVSWSASVTVSDTFDIDPGDYGYVDAGVHYALYYVKMKKRGCHNYDGGPAYCGPWYYYSGYVQHHLAATVAFFDRS
jgi:RHS repeat-associated protein